jgi:hypothetical protein
MNLNDARQVLKFLNSIEGSGYGGMSEFEIARQSVAKFIENGEKAMALLKEAARLSKSYGFVASETDKIPRV